MFINNLMQDGALHTIRAKEPKYLPTIMGGSGSPSLFGSAKNLYLYVICYRGGGHSRVYGTSAQEILSTFKKLEETGSYEIPRLTMQLRDKENYLRITYKDKVFVPDKQYQSLFSETALPPPLYKDGGIENKITAGESRLVGAKLLIGEASAKIEQDKTIKLKSVIFGLIDVTGQKKKDKIQLMEARAEFEGSLSTNTAVARLLQKKGSDSDADALMKSSFFHMSQNGAREFTMAHASWVNDGCKSDVFDLRDLRRPEDMYIRDEISTEEDLKISGLQRIWKRKGEYVLTESRATVGLWNVTDDQYANAAHILERLRKAREMVEGSTLPKSVVANIYYNNRENIADDTLILQRAIEKASNYTMSSHFCVIVTEDHKLCDSVARKSGFICLRISPASLLEAFGADTANLTELIDGKPLVFNQKVDLQGFARFSPDKLADVYVDTGSLQSTLARVVSESGPTRKKKQPGIFKRDILSVSSTKLRWEKVALTEIPVKANGKVKIKYSSVDAFGRTGLSVHRPDAPYRTRLAKYESYRNPTSIHSEIWKDSETDSTLSASVAAGTEVNYIFTPFLSSDNLD